MECNKVGDKLIEAITFGRRLAAWSCDTGVCPCCAVLCCAVLCCAALRCAALRCAVLCWAALCCAVLAWPGLCHAKLGQAGLRTDICTFASLEAKMSWQNL